MGKKSRVKAESRTSAEEETTALEKEVYIPVPEEGGIINFYYLFGGLGILTAILMIAFLLNIF
jgi:hypothetical protein